ncbi:MAG: SurA N-terminal domain-containing protein [Armatimonadota bacterium]
MKKQELAFGIMIGAVVTSGLFVTSGCKGKTAEVMATVNGEQITREDFYTYMEHKPSVMVQTPQGAASANVATPLNFQSLNDLINQKLLEQMAKDEGVYPTEQEIKDEISFQQTKNQGFVKTLTGQGYTMSEIRRQLALERCRFKLITKGIKISDSQIDNYIKNNPQQFVNPKTVDLSWVVVKDEATQKEVDSAIKAGDNFSIVATRYSVAKTPTYPSRLYSQFPDRLKQVVDKLAEGGTSDWLVDGANKVRFRVEKKTEASKIEIKPWMKTEISRALATQKGSVAVDLDKRLLAKRKDANLSVTPTGLKEQFDNIAKSLKESDVKAGTSTTAETNPK